MVAVLLAALWPVGASAAQTELERAKDVRESLEQRLGDIAEQLQETQGRIEKATEARAELEAEVAELTQAAAEAEEAMTAQAVYAYKNGTRGSFGLVLEAESALEALDRAQIIGSLTRNDQQIVERASAARIALRQRRAELADLLGDLDAEQARLDALRADLAGAFEQAQDREAELEGRQARKRSVDR
ncbi:MAG TPA: hypothetical protein VML96_09775, partial [Egibacteraceae bacterium]|nr:hypothetical protein [Egibacteraceae bacterium]